MSASLPRSATPADDRDAARVSAELRSARSSAPILRPVAAVPARSALPGLPVLRAVPHPDRYLDQAAFDSSTDTDVPPPAVMTIQKLALYAFEALEGSRSVAQLGGWITREVAAALLERRAARTERRTLYRDARRVVACPGPAHIDRPLPHIIEATVVLYAEPRSRSVALRLEHNGSRWRATDLTVL
ncbi:Rv3235 family protein [Leucobacter celer]|uniref:Rv3235 family protein n=1 Tax=Leucobacter celer TaxID=668625 RepID=UPI000AF8D96B|nr:Rv3235 family protein [Leucobacter celer]